MRAHQRLIAFLLLFGWLFATGHVALRHGGVADGGVHHALAADGDDDDHDHDDAPPQDSQHHHHDLTIVSGGQAAKCEQAVLAPVWLPLCDALIARLAAARCGRAAPAAGAGTFAAGCASVRLAFGASDRAPGAWS